MAPRYVIPEPALPCPLLFLTFSWGRTWKRYCSSDRSVSAGVPPVPLGCGTKASIQEADLTL